ncbi:hypothetical protein Tco_1338663 [Tanacetum coccineum]
MYYQVFRGDGSSKNYKVLSEMLEDFDRQDVEELYRLVKEKYSASRLEGYDLMLWGDLYTLFESDEEDEIWKNQHEYNLISWRLCDFCGIHILLMENGLAIHMLTKKKYPLSQELLSKILNTAKEKELILLMVKAADLEIRVALHVRVVLCVQVVALRVGVSLHVRVVLCGQVALRVGVDLCVRVALRELLFV